ncbi:hypothetical protein [Bacillus sp. AFS001701]|nr:hypothetical protein [Bacillus sp. AFS001701]
MALRIIKRTFGTKDIQEAFQEALEPYFQDEVTIETILNNQKDREEEGK